MFQNKLKLIYADLILGYYMACEKSNAGAFDLGFIHSNIKDIPLLLRN